MTTTTTRQLELENDQFKKTQKISKPITAYGMTHRLPVNLDICVLITDILLHKNSYFISNFNSHGITIHNWF